jgi:hypothetical protein
MFAPVDVKTEEKVLHRNPQKNVVDSTGIAERKTGTID